MPWFERKNGERKFFPSNSQGAAWVRTGRNPRDAQRGLDEASKEMPPEKFLDDSPLASRIRVRKLS